MDDFDHVFEIQILRREISELRTEIDRVDDWANGIFVAMQDLVLELLRMHPQLARNLHGGWEAAADQYELLRASTEQQADFHETMELLEARKILFRVSDLLGLWKERSPKK